MVKNILLSFLYFWGRHANHLEPCSLAGHATHAGTKASASIQRPLAAPRAAVGVEVVSESNPKHEDGGEDENDAATSSCTHHYVVVVQALRTILHAAESFALSVTPHRFGITPSSPSMAFAFTSLSPWPREVPFCLGL